jgi:hypothetical protein
MNILRWVWDRVKPDPVFWEDYADYADWLDEFLYGDERY